MKSEGVFFGAEQFNRLCPFYVLIDENLIVESYGKSIEKLAPGFRKRPSGELLQFKRPYLEKTDRESILSLVNQLIVIELIDKKISLRGQLEVLNETGNILFIGSPWFGSMEQVRENGLKIHDFAFHDPLIDLLHVLKTQEITNSELKQLLATVTQQKKDLKIATKQIEEIAMFPNENPDPLFRIRLDGEIIMMNPAAEKFDSFQYGDKIYSKIDFWKVLISEIDLEKERWTFEVASGGQIFSFLCRPLLAKGYVNIYGRNVTASKKNEEELKRLSLVASANENGIVFTRLDGKIYWANKGFTDLTGYETEDIIGKTPIDLLKGKSTNKEELRKMVDAFEKGESFNIEVAHYRKDGSWFWGRSKGQAIKSDNGQVMQYFSMTEDTTEEKALYQRFEILSKIAEDNLNSVVITDQEGKITWVNKSFLELSCYSFEEVVGKKPGRLMQGPDTDPQTVAYLSKQIKAGQPFSAEILNYNKNRKPYWLRILGQPIYSSEGELIGFFALEQDITREREIDEEIKAAENKFLISLQKIGDNVWDHDFRSGITTFSKSTSDLLGIEPNEEVTTAKLWWESVHPDDIAKLEEQDRNYRNGKSDSHATEYRLRHKSDSIKWVLDRGVVIEKDRHGLPLRIVGIHTDITSIKQTEKDLENRVRQFKSLSENIPAVVYEYEYNLDGTEQFRYVSPAVEEMFGFTAEEFSKNILNYIHEEERELFRLKNTAARDLQQAFINDFRVVIPGRGTIWLAVSASFSYITETESSVFTGIISDITQQKDLETRLVKAREEAMKLARTKEAFLANMSHEIRTPLNGIIGMIRELAKMELSSKQKLYINNAGTASQHLLSIINNILDLSKIEAGSFDLEKKPLNIRQLLLEVESILKTSATEKLIELKFNVAKDTAYNFLGDASRIRQVLINVLSNSIKFTEQGGVRLECIPIDTQATRQTIRISIIDTGIGMDPDFLKTIFNKFTQENDTIQRKYGGTGLGMAITYELIQLMKGEINVSSTKGKGSQFDITLTLDIDAESPIHAEKVIDYKKVLSGKRILLVEDNEMNRMVAINLLDHYHVVTEEAIHGEEALIKLQTGTFDLILMDLQMPVMDGLEATRMIRKQNITTPIIALTANAFKNEVDKCIAAGMNDFATKPFNEEVLLNTLVKNLPNLPMPEKDLALEKEGQKLYDLSRLIAMSRGKKEFVKKMTNIFHNQITELIPALELALQNQDINSINRLAHKIKPSMGEMGVIKIKEEILFLEKATTPLNEIEENIRKVVDTLKQVIDQLQEDL